MKWVLCLLLLVVLSARADAQDGPPSSSIFDGTTPGDTSSLNSPTASDKPGGEGGGWLSWVEDIIDWLWSWFEVAWYYLVEVPADWVRRLCKGWFCYLARATLRLVWDVLQLDRWSNHQAREALLAGWDAIAKMAGFLGKIVPFGLWAVMCGLYLTTESTVAVVRWVISLLPGT